MTSFNTRRTKEEENGLKHLFSIMKSESECFVKRGYGGESMKCGETTTMRMRPVQRTAEWKGCYVHSLAHNPARRRIEHLTGRKPITGNGSVDSAYVVTLFTGTYALCY